MNRRLILCVGGYKHPIPYGEDKQIWDAMRALLSPFSLREVLDECPSYTGLLISVQVEEHEEGDVPERDHIPNAERMGAPQWAKSQP